MSKEDIHKVLGRGEWAFVDTEIGSPILVTGALGSIGEALCERLRGKGYTVFAKDVNDMDVRNPRRVNEAMCALQPNVVFHLAGAKHAPNGEEDPYGVAMTNTIGTANVLDFAPKDCVVVVASTCKAANPETAYGASKLIAERMALNAGQRVARFYNVVESAENVFETWAAVPSDEPISVTACERYFISLDEALSLLIYAAAAPSGRYTVQPGQVRRMPNVALALYPGRQMTLIERRRGDRMREPLYADHERTHAIDHPFIKIESPHDRLEEKK
jgi:FlaA1/EpsC-like NDP-sugar epimerase